MTSWHDALIETWNELRRTTSVFRQYRSRLLSVSIPLQVYAGMRASDDAPCLMLRTAIDPDALFDLDGMRLSTASDGDVPLLILSLEDGSRLDFFTTICVDVITSADAAEKSEAQTVFLTRIDAWRQFLRDRRGGLSRSEIVGLIGELLVLDQLLEANPLCLGSWKAPTDGLQDFEAGGHALEIKTVLGPASTITISRLDQLDAAGLRRLDLLHVRLVEAAKGRSLRDLIKEISGRLPDESHRRIFENALLRCGLLPGDETARSSPRVELRTIDAYGVTGNFPRLLRSALPVAITEASYVIEVRAIAAFSADLAVALDAFRRGDHG